DDNRSSEACNREEDGARRGMPTCALTRVAFRFCSSQGTWYNDPGSYSVLAGAAVGAEGLTFEPGGTFPWLRRNLERNTLSKVRRGTRLLAPRTASFHSSPATTR